MYYQGDPNKAYQTLTNPWPAALLFLGDIFYWDRANALFLETVWKIIWYDNDLYILFCW